MIEHAQHIVDQIDRLTFRNPRKYYLALEWIRLRTNRTHWQPRYRHFTGQLSNLTARMFDAIHTYREPKQ